MTGMEDLRIIGMGTGKNVEEVLRAVVVAMGLNNL
jgi:hypothetical protein